jgi:hypothetical protein
VIDRWKGIKREPGYWTTVANEVDRLKAIIKRYARHDVWCAHVEHHHAACDCGLVEARATIERKP